VELETDESNAGCDLATSALWRVCAGGSSWSEFIENEKSSIDAVDEANEVGVRA
jgi:hypothetical protein